MMNRLIVRMLEAGEPEPKIKEVMTIKPSTDLGGAFPDWCRIQRKVQPEEIDQ